MMKTIGSLARQGDATPFQKRPTLASPDFRRAATKAFLETTVFETNAWFQGSWY